MLHYDVKRLTIRLFYTGLGLGETNDEDVEIFAAEYEKEYISSRRPMEGAIDTLMKLNEQGYRLAIVTNGQTLHQRQKAQDIGVLSLVEFLLASGELVRKPGRAIFRSACERMGVEAGRCLMVGDDVNADVGGAIGVGMGAVLFYPDGEGGRRLLFGEEVAVIRTMGELLEMLEESPAMDRAAL